MDIAVIIVTYRSANLTVDCLRSVERERSRAGLNVRVIVVDNASGDAPFIENAVRINDWASWVELIVAPHNGGFAYGNNLGIAKTFSSAAPVYFYLLNPDTLVRPGAISALVEFLEIHPNVGIAGGSFEDIDGKNWNIAFRFPTLIGELIGGLEFGLVTRFFKRWEVAMEMRNEPQLVDWICGASMMIRSSVFSKIGGLDENYFLYYEETDFCFRANRAGIATWYVPESRVMHIMGQSTQVTDLRYGPKRLPPYWFESRRRYFVVTFGLKCAIAIDVVALIAHALGWLKRLTLRRRQVGVPYFLRDLIRHSVLKPRNRHFPPLKCAGVEHAVKRACGNDELSRCLSNMIKTEGFNR